MAWKDPGPPFYIQKCWAGGAGTSMSYVALEGEVEAADGEDRYNLRLAGRMMF